MDTSRKRNFCIIAHIDHGKSTLADRFIERARLVTSRGPQQTQILDNMDIERERGITIKSQAVTIPYTAADGKEYELNLVDTPGHVDFTYEVSRAISSCEGALLLIDASQGVEAQTLANLYLAMEHNLEIIPVINKIDLPSADIDSCLHQIDHDLGLDPDMAVKVSAKTGEGVDDLFEAIVNLIPAPDGKDDDLSDEDQSVRTEVAALFLADMDEQFREKNTAEKQDDGDEVTQCVESAAGGKSDGHQNEVRGLRVGEHAAPCHIGICVHKSARKAQQDADLQPFVYGVLRKLSAVILHGFIVS